MPLIIIALVSLLAIGFVPLLFVLRVRFGSARRRARTWVANLNVILLSISVLLFFVSAGIVNGWVPEAFRFALIGFVCGLLLSLFGLAFTRWEKISGALYYTPSRWFALIVPAALTLRIVFWFWRAAHQWRVSPDTKSWLTNSGTAGSIAIGAAVAGYYFGYAVGIWRRVHARRSG